MDRSEILATMVDMKLFGMTVSYDEIITTAVERQHEPRRIVGGLLQAEIAEKQSPDQVSAHHRKVTPGQRHRGVAVRQHTNQREAGA